MCLPCRHAQCGGAVSACSDGSCDRIPPLFRVTKMFASKHTINKTHPRLSFLSSEAPPQNVLFNPPLTLITAAIIYELNQSKNTHSLHIYCTLHDIHIICTTWQSVDDFTGSRFCNFQASLNRRANACSCSFHY
jgi:hypothetical protein